MNETSSESAELEAIKSSLPLKAPIYLPTSKLSVREQIDGLKRVKRLYDGRLDSHYRPKLEALMKAHSDRRRAFVIGNGPSLNRTDLSLLKDEVTFCTNGFFHKYAEIDWRPTYYMVEDHLVAEDNATELNALTGSTKLFPAYLAYCLDEGHDTVFFDHRPRPSYPDGFDFSDDISKRTYTGCTVTFTALQAAASMGFDEIFLVGVDSDYKIPSSVQRSDEYGVAILDMDEDDPNHFNGSYFGRGKRWHDPQVDKMIEAYKEAKRSCEAKGRAILNATVWGKLEVFSRIGFENVFRPDAAAFPHIVLIDMVPMGTSAASSQLKKRLFEPWPAGRILSISASSDAGYVLQLNGMAQSRCEIFDISEVKTLIEAFGAEVLINRPMPERPHLSELANTLADDGMAMITWLMDDWVGQLEADPDRAAHRSVSLFHEGVRASSGLWSISEEMSAVLKARYAREALPIANGINEAEWDSVHRVARADSKLTFRFGGSLSPTMSSATLKAIAEVIEELDTDFEVELIIKTSDYWKGIIGDQFNPFSKTRIETLGNEETKYFQELVDADVNIISYNFDEQTGQYCRTSLGNKLPELLRAGRPILAVGPADFATMQRLNSARAQIVHTDELCEIRQAITELIANLSSHEAAALENQDLARDRFDIRSVRAKLTEHVRSLAKPGSARVSANVLAEQMEAIAVKARGGEGGAPQEPTGPLSRLGSGLKEFSTYLLGWRLAALIFAFAAKGYAILTHLPHSGLVSLAGDGLIVFVVLYSLAQLHAALTRR